jgi:hypothetical protein
MQDTRQPVERWSECRATHTYTLATRVPSGTYYQVCSCHAYVHVYVRTKSTMERTGTIWYVRILETGGRVNKAARDWLDALTAPEPGEQVPSQDDHPWNPQTRTTTETVLREAMQALVRVQAHMLARIVVEIRAADIAVELEPQL